MDTFGLPAATLTVCAVWVTAEHAQLMLGDGKVAYAWRRGNTVGLVCHRDISLEVPRHHLVELITDCKKRCAHTGHGGCFPPTPQ